MAFVETVNVFALLVPPPPFAVGLFGSTAGPVNTATEAQLSVVNRFAGTVAVNCDAEPKVVTRFVVVLDIRYNGGGFLNIAAELAYMIAGPTASAGRAFYQLHFNDQHPTIDPFTGLPFVAVFCTKLDPVRVSMTSALPGAAITGEIEVKTGTGFAGAVTMKAIVLDSPLSCLLVIGFKVLTKWRPGVAVSAAGTLAVTFVALLLTSTVTVVSRFLPSH